MQIGVMGAGAIGGFVGGRLAAAGHEVTLVGRPRVLDPIAAHGLVLADLEHGERRVPPSAIRCATDASALAGCEAVLVAVKSGGTAEAARALAAVLPDDVLVVSLQNGVSNRAVLRDALGSRAHGGMVAWNVVWSEAPDGAPILRRATSGTVVIERSSGAPSTIARRREQLVRALREAGIDTREHDEIERVSWTKLLFNLNNAVNALSGLPLREQLLDRGYRRVMAACIGEGLDAMRAAGIRPVRIGLMDPRIARLVLPLPTWLFSRLAQTMIRIDPAARSSMADDLARGARTEIDELNGAVVRLGAAHGVPTPVNARIADEVRRAEREGARSPRIPAADLRGR